MGCVNRVILVGNLGHDPELAYADSGRPYLHLSIATSERRKDRDGQRTETTEWHKITVFGELAETCSKYLAKGRSVYVEGRLTTRTWEGRDGGKRSAAEIIAERVVFLGGDAGERPAGASAAAPADPGSQARPAAAARSSGPAPSSGGPRDGRPAPATHHERAPVPDEDLW